jgi:hypothetical protein
MMTKEMFYIPIKLKPELARASMTTSDVNNQWRKRLMSSEQYREIYMNIDHVVFVVLLYFQTFCVTYSGILGYMNVSDVKIRYHWSMEALILFVPLLTDTKTTVGRQPMHLRGWPCVMGDNFICSVFSNI